MGTDLLRSTVVERHSASCFHTVPVPQDDPLVCIKVVNVLHRVLQEGHPAVLRSAQDVGSFAAEVAARARSQANVGGDDGAYTSWV
jgi:ANTH domain-containing protein